MALLLGALPGSVDAHPEASGEAADSVEVAVRSPDPSTLASYRDDPAYVYERQGGPSWWDRLKAWMLEQLRAAFDVDGVPILARILAVLVLAGMLLLVVRWVLQARGSPPLKTTEELEEEPTVTRETLETTDFATKAHRAAAQGGYRRAVRFQYLWLLQRLVEEGYVRWTPDKTNGDLVAETRGRAVYEDFSRATEWFEVVWYGSLSLERDAFERIRGIMEAAREHLDASARPAASS